MTEADNPCTRCGACCTAFRVDFATAELASHGGSVPDGLAVELGTTAARMRGTDHTPARCAALVGQPGVRVHCAIYEWRPSPCREFGLRAVHGVGDDACDRARARRGWPPLRPPGTPDTTGPPCTRGTTAPAYRLPID